MTGASLSLQRAHQLLRLAEQHDLHIVEDDTYAHLAPAHLPRLAALADRNEEHFFGHMSPPERQALMKAFEALAAHHHLKELPVA